MLSTPHAAPSKPAPSVPRTSTETPVNAPGRIAIDSFTDVREPRSLDDRGIDLTP